MKVIWDSLAIRERNQVANYIQRHFGTKRKERFLSEVREATQMLKRNSGIGSIDPLFADRPIAYRSIVINGLSKMVYYINGDAIYIAAFWDCRKEPKSQIAKMN